MTAYYSGRTAAMPFWVNPGLKFTTVLYALVLTTAGAAILGVLPALKTTGWHAQASSGISAPEARRCDSAGSGRR